MPDANIDAVLAKQAAFRADLIADLRAAEARIAGALTALGEVPAADRPRRGRPPGSRNGAGTKRKAGVR